MPLPRRPGSGIGIAAVPVLWLVLLAVAPAARAAEPGEIAQANGNGVEGAAAGELTPVAVPAPTDKAVQFHRSGNRLWVVLQLWTMAVQVLLLFSGLSARLRTMGRRIGRVWILTIGVYWL